MTAPVTFEVEVDTRTVGVEVTPNPAVTVAVNPAPQVIVAAVPGTPGAQGPAGTGGFTYTQSSPAATWTITNTLGRYPTSVSVWIAGEEVDADVETPDTSTVVITFSSPQSGRAELI